MKPVALSQGCKPALDSRGRRWRVMVGPRRSGHEVTVVSDSRVGGGRDRGDGDGYDAANPVTISSDDNSVDDVVHKMTTASSRSNDHRMVAAHQLMVTRGVVGTTSWSRRRGLADWSRQLPSDAARGIGRPMPGGSPCRFGPRPAGTGGTSTSQSRHYFYLWGEVDRPRLSAILGQQSLVRRMGVVAAS